MDLKNAIAVCLISLSSATLVLLIARSLDLQAASRLEPQLVKIVEELEALRKQGGIAPASAAVFASESVDDGLIVYYFHGNTRCPTCRSIESQAYETVQSDFAAELGSGEVVWKTLNYEERAVADLAKKFEIQVPMVVLAKMQGGQIEDWKSLGRVWSLVDDKPAFADYVRDEINPLLGANDTQPTATSADDAADIPVPDAEPSEISDPTETADIPIPQ